MLKQRIITAIILISLVATSIIYLPFIYLAVFFAVMVLIAAWEWSNLIGQLTFLSRSAFTLACALLIAATAWHAQLLSDVVVSRVQDILGVACVWWSIALLWVKAYPASAVIWRSLFMRTLMGFLTLVPAWLALVFLRLQENGIELIFILIMLVTAADIGAYFSGIRWGKNKLAPAVSPGKSWQGFWGGLMASMLLSALIWFLWGQAHFTLQAVVAVTVVTVLGSVLGDLLESMVKRERGIKDSGTILPGHGGMMDRLDSMTAAAPIFALSLILIG